MKALVYQNHAISLTERKKPEIISSRDAIVKVTLSSICTSDLHIIKGFVPRAKDGIVLGHEFVGEVVETGSEITNLKVEGRGSRTEDVRLHILYFLFVPLVYSLICYFKSYIYAS